jgi:hypothetical protein
MKWYFSSGNTFRGTYVKSIGNSPVHLIPLIFTTYTLLSYFCPKFNYRYL